MRKLFAFFISFILLGCGSDNQNTNIESDTEKKLINILISPSEITSNGIPTFTLINGSRQQFIATGKFQNGSTQDITKTVTWESHSDIGSELVRIIQGRVDAIKAGKVQISASFEGIVSNSIDLSIIDSQLTKVSQKIDETRDITNSDFYLGQTAKLQVIGTFENSATAILGDPIEWTMTPDQSAQINNEERTVTFSNAGTMTVTAIKDGLISEESRFNVKDLPLKSILIVPENNENIIPNGHSVRLSVIGTYIDGKQKEITTGITWSTEAAQTSTGSVHITENGYLTAQAKGKVHITARVKNPEEIKNTLDFTVTDALLKNLSIKPNSLNLITGNQSQLTVFGIYSNTPVGSEGIDMTNDVSWDILEGSSALVTNGLVTATDTVGKTRLVAKITIDGQTITSNEVSINVTEAQLQSIRIIGLPESIFTNDLHQIKAIGTYDEGKPEQDITHMVSWSSSVESMLSITSGSIKSNNTYGAEPIAITARINDIQTTQNTRVQLGILTVSTLDGKIFTSSPTTALGEYLQILPETNNIEEGTTGPKDISFALYDHEKSQLFCEALNKNKLLSKTNWQQATKNELHETLIPEYSDLFKSHGWPTQWFYGTNTKDGDNYYAVFFLQNLIHSGPASVQLYRSCVSAP